MTNTLVCRLTASGLVVGSDGPMGVEVVTVGEAVEWRETLARCEVLMCDDRPGREVAVTAWLPGEGGILPGIVVKGMGRVSGEQVVRLLARLDECIALAAGYVAPESVQAKRNKARKLQRQGAA